LSQVKNGGRKENKKSQRHEDIFGIFFDHILPNIAVPKAQTKLGDLTDRVLCQ
jgi:hypothetical protein